MHRRFVQLLFCVLLLLAFIINEPRLLYVDSSISTISTSAYWYKKLQDFSITNSIRIEGNCVVLGFLKFCFLVILLVFFGGGMGEGTTHGGTPVIHSEVPGKTPYPTTWWKTAVMTIQHSLVIKLATSHVVSATVRTVKVTAMKDGKQQRWGRGEGEDWVTLRCWDLVLYSAC